MAFNASSFQTIDMLSPDESIVKYLLDETETIAALGTDSMESSTAGNLTETVSYVSDPVRISLRRGKENNIR